MKRPARWSHLQDRLGRDSDADRIWVVVDTEDPLGMTWIPSRAKPQRLIVELPVRA